MISKTSAIKQEAEIFSSQSCKPLMHEMNMHASHLVVMASSVGPSTQFKRDRFNTSTMDAISQIR